MRYLPSSSPVVQAPTPESFSAALLSSSENFSMSRDDTRSDASMKTPEKHDFNDGDDLRATVSEVSTSMLPLNNSEVYVNECHDIVDHENLDVEVTGDDTKLMHHKKDVRPRRYDSGSLKGSCPTTTQRRAFDYRHPVTPSTPIHHNPSQQIDNLCSYPQIGLSWEVKYFNTKIKWKQDPTIESIKTVLRQRIGPSRDYEVKHIWNGGTYNKFFSVNVDDKRYVMKVTLPVCPRTKTEGEVTALRWTRANTNLTCIVPNVVDYSSSANNPIGCEWILMTRLEGIPLSSCWRDVSLGSKERIIRALAEYSRDVYLQQFIQIGNLFPAPLPCRGRRYQVGKLSSMPFFWNTAAWTGLGSGPFRTTKEWSLRRLNVVHKNLREQFRDIKHWPAEKQNIWWRMAGLVEVDSRLWRLHDKLFPAPKPSEEDNEVEGHEVRVIRSPEFLASPLTPVSMPSYHSDDAISEGSDSNCHITDEAHKNKRYRLTNDAGFSEAFPNQSQSSQISSGFPGQGQTTLLNLYSTPVELGDRIISKSCGLLASPETAAEMSIQRNIRKQGNDNQFARHTSGNKIEQENLKTESLTQSKASLASQFGDWEPLHLDAEEYIQNDQDIHLGAQPTMLWHDNLSTDNILVDPVTHTLTGILDWDCVSCIPVPLACDWPAFLHEGRHRTTEPEVDDHVVWIPEQDGKRRQPSFDPLNDQVDIREKQRSRLALQANYWRARRDFELTYLRKAFLEEMQHKCPAWYETWKQSRVRKDYEAAVQNCNNEYVIHRVEDWVEAVEVALEKGQEVKPPQVPNLHYSIYDSKDWKEWDDLDDLSVEWMKPIRERERLLEGWCNDLDELDKAKKAVPYAKGAATNAARKASNTQKGLARAKASIDKATYDLQYLEGLDHQGLDLKELEDLRRVARTRLNDATETIEKGEDNLAELEFGAKAAEQRYDAALIRALTAKQKVESNEEFQKLYCEKKFNFQTWNNLNRALIRSFGDNKDGNWWEHRLEPLGYCMKNKDSRTVPGIKWTSEDEAMPDEQPSDAESDVSEEE